VIPYKYRKKRPEKSACRKKLDGSSKLPIYIVGSPQQKAATSFSLCPKNSAGNFYHHAFALALRFFVPFSVAK